MEKEIHKDPIKILYLEDNIHDAELLHSVLKHDGLVCDLKRVETRVDFAAALDAGGWELIISDYSLPSYDGLNALALAREKAPGIPFILFSGTIGEETAVECLKRGATDYILKQRPARLVSAVRQTIREAEEHRRFAAMQVELRKSEEQARLLELQCLRMQRMESIGALVGGVAHDLNNALVPILIGVDYLQSATLTSDAREMLTTMRASARRGAEMIRHVLAFARGVENRETSIKVNLLLREMERIVQDIFPKSIRCKTHAPVGLWPVSGSTTQLHQVLMNLCINARDAMPQGGLLTISGENVHVSEEQARLYLDVKPGRYLAITVSDTGTGIPPEVLEKIFQPFFTTKEPTKGTGLGLSTTMSIVKAHEGFITVKSEVGSGTVFTVHLPAANVANASEVVAKAPVLPTGNGELILVVDDEAAICEITKVTLENYGYKVLTAGSGPEAVAMLAEKRSEIQLALTDTEMPFMDGRSTCLALWKLNPTLKIITASGSEHKDSDTTFRSKVNALIHKPYTVENLLVTVHSVLSKSAAN